MTVKRNLVAQDHGIILSRLPPGTARIQVVDEAGKTGWRAPSEVSIRDTIVLNNDGNPIIMSGNPGRKRKIEILPASDVIAEIVRRKKAAVKEDPLVDSVRKKPETSKVLDRVMEGLAEEAASLSFEREEAERKGQETSNISIRRVNALKAVGDTWLKRKEQLTANSVDMDSPAFGVVFKLIMETLRSSMEQAGLRPEQVETVFARFSKRVDDTWKAEARARMKGV